MCEYWSATVSCPVLIFASSFSVHPCISLIPNLKQQNKTNPEAGTPETATRPAVASSTVAGSSVRSHPSPEPPISSLQFPSLCAFGSWRSLTLSRKDRPRHPALSSSLLLTGPAVWPPGASATLAAVATPGPIPEASAKVAAPRSSWHLSGTTQDAVLQSVWSSLARSNFHSRLEPPESCQVLAGQLDTTRHLLC